MKYAYTSLLGLSDVYNFSLGTDWLVGWLAGWSVGLVVVAILQSL